MLFQKNDDIEKKYRDKLRHDDIWNQGIYEEMCFHKIECWWRLLPEVYRI